MECLKEIMIMILSWLLLPNFSFAAEPLLDKNTATGGPKSDPKDVIAFVARVQNIIFGVAGIIAVAMIVAGGIMYMLAGSNDEKITKAKQILTYAIGGLLIVVLSYAIVYVLVTMLGGNIE